MQKLLSIRPLNDNTSGFRFDLVGIKGLYRKRKIQRRWGVNQNGDTFVQIHFGKRSVYIEQFKPVRRLYDFALLQHVQSIAKSAESRINQIRGF